MNDTTHPIHPVRRTLVVDDDNFMCDLLREMLGNLGVTHVETASDGFQAMELLREDGAVNPDILVCDLAMPGMDGVEFLRHLANLDYAGGIVLLSGTSPRILHSAEQLARAHGLQLLGILEKPVSLSALSQVLAKFAPSLERHPAKTYLVKLTEAEIREGLANGFLTVHFQPKVSVASRQMVGVECLARWQDPVRGTLPPSAFIEVAEQAGLVSQITQSVFRQAARWASEWKQSGHSIRVSVNISMDDVGRLDLPEQLTAWATEVGIPNDRLVLELTESRLMSDQKVNLDIITRLRLKEFGLSIDDFGTGYSTLEKLTSLPFTELKIDKAFVHGVGHDRASRAILESSVLLGRALGLSLVAEGVETQEDWDVIAQLGIDEVQGYFVSRPLVASELLDWKLAWERKSMLDLNRLRELVGGNPSAHARILEKFLVVVRHGLHEISIARERNDLAALGALGHKLKSSARSVGAHTLADACQALEYAGEAGDMARCTSLIDEISHHFAPVASYIEQRLEAAP